MLDTAIVPAPAVAADGESLAAHLFERHHVEVFAYLVRMVHDREWAQDLAQETFVQAYRHRDRLAGLHNPRAWLYRVATNLTLNALRRRRRFAWLPWEWHEGQTHAPDPTEAVSRQAQVEAALAGRPSWQVAGSALRGVGVPDCIADGRRAVRLALETSAA